MKQSRIHVRPVVFISTLVVLILVACPPPSALAILPPRPSPGPAATPAPQPVGGMIELTVETAPEGLWTVVQWQDALGGWHDVDGWRGSLDDDIRKTWWVDRADFGKGPFRWALYQHGGSLVTSDSFNLPIHNGEIVRVWVSLKP